MEHFNFELLASAQSLGDDFESDPIAIPTMALLSIQAIWTGTPAGTFSLQTSNDPGEILVNGEIRGVTNWTDFTGSSNAAGGAAGNCTWGIIGAPDRFVRVKFVHSSSTGSLTSIRVNAKET